MDGVRRKKDLLKNIIDIKPGDPIFPPNATIQFVTDDLANKKKIVYAEFKTGTNKKD